MTHLGHRPNDLVPIALWQPLAVWYPLGIFCCMALILVGCSRKPTAIETSEIAPGHSSRDPMTVESAVQPIGMKTVIRTEPDDEWTHEILHGAVKPRLALLAELISRDDMDAKRFDELTSSNYSGRRLRPHNLRTAFNRFPIEVRRADAATRRLRASVDLKTAIAELVRPMRGQQRRVELKVIGIESNSVRTRRASRDGNTKGMNAFTTKVKCQISARGPERRIQQNTLWTCRWTLSPEALVLDGIEISENHFAEIIVDGPTELFTDATEQAMSTVDCFQPQLLPPTSFWLERIESSLGIDIVGLHGLAVADVNNDGLDDVYLCMPAGLPNRLLMHQADGTLTDVSAGARVDFLDLSRHALFVDFDNDGDQDLAVHLNASVVFLRNEKMRFEPATQVPVASSPYSLSAADYDDDGRVDLFVTGREPIRADRRHANVLGQPIPYHDANNGGRNLLLRNQGEMQFTDVTIESGIDQNNRRFSYAASWADYDEDGDVDLYVANDFGRNNLYRNDGGRFAEVAGDAGIEDIAAGMSVAWADLNVDGHLDLYVGNMFSSAGRRIAFQDYFMPHVNRRTKTQYRRHARGNSLFQNQADGTFSDLSKSSGAHAGRWAWSCNPVDLNNDGFADLAVANGFVTNENADDL